MKLKFFIAGLAVVAGLASAVSCQDLTKDLTDLKSKVASLESTVQALQSKIDAGAVITSVTPSNSGIKITLSNGNSYEITNGVNGKDGANGKDGKDGKDGADGTPGSVVTIGDNGNWFIDGVDTGLAAQGEDGADGTPGAFFVPDPETGCFDMFVWDPEKGEYVSTPTEIPFVAEGTLTAVYNPLTGVVTLYGIEGYEGGYEIGGSHGGAVTSVELESVDPTAPYALAVITELDAPAFGPKGELTFTAGEEVGLTQTFIVKVTPADVTLSKSDVTLINSKGESVDVLEVVSVEPHEGALTKAATDFALWDVTVALTEKLSADELVKAFGVDALGNRIAFAAKIGEAVSPYDITFHGTPYTAKKAVWVAGDTTYDPIWVSATNNPYDYTIDALRNRIVAKDWGWIKNSKKNPTPVVKVVTKDDDSKNYNADIDDRFTTPGALLVAALEKPITITFDTDQYKAVWAEIDYKQSTDPSELAAWRSYEPNIEGLNTLCETGTLQIVVNDTAAEDDIIEFRVYAVNWNGVLADPDGISFEAIFGTEPEPEEWTAPDVTTIVPAYAESYNTGDDMSDFVAWSGKKLADASYVVLSIDNNNLSDVWFGACLAYTGADKKTKYQDIPAYTPVAFKDWDKVIGLATYTENRPYAGVYANAYSSWADEEEYAGTITIYNAYDFELASFEVTTMKALPEAAPAGIQITKKEGILVDNSITRYADDFVASNVAYTAFSGAKWTTRTNWYNDATAASPVAATVNDDKKAFYDAMGTIANVLDLSKVITVKMPDVDKDGADDFSNTNVIVSVPNADYSQSAAGKAVTTNAVERTGATLATPVSVAAALVNGANREVKVTYNYGIISAEYDIETDAVVPATKPTVKDLDSFNFLLTTKAQTMSYNWNWNVAEMSNVAGLNVPPFAYAQWSTSNLDWKTNYPSLNANWYYANLADLTAQLKAFAPYVITKDSKSNWDYAACKWDVTTAPVIDWSGVAAAPATWDINIAPYIYGESSDTKLAPAYLVSNTTSTVYLPKTSEAKVLSLNKDAVAMKWNKTDYFTVAEKEITPGNHDWTVVSFTKQDSYAPTADVKGTLSFVLYDFLYNPIPVSVDVVISD